ncbi:hypothetical protein ACI07_24715, partial [Salmonella enterica subsp. enterica serovar 4,12:i:-]
GGVPVAGEGEGVEAVIDKDLAAALLAEQIAADGLIILTDAVRGMNIGGRRSSALFVRLRMSWRRLPKPMARWDRRGPREAGC